MALRDQPYLPLYVQDFITDEKLCCCSASANGVYIWLMCLLHKCEEYGCMELQDWQIDETKSMCFNFAFRLSRQMPFDVEDIERALSELLRNRVIEIDGKRLMQKRMVRDGNLSKIKASAGKMGGRPKKANEKQNEKQNESKQKAKQKQNTENENENEYEYENKKKKGVLGGRFDEFWSAYPRKVGKGDARKRWEKIKPDDTLFEKIMASVEAAKQSKEWRKDNGEYIPYPATWLNREGWEDDLSGVDLSSGEKDDTMYGLEEAIERARREAGR